MFAEILPSPCSKYRKTSKLLLFLSGKLFSKEGQTQKWHSILAIRYILCNVLKTVVSFLSQRCWPLVNYIIAASRHHQKADNKTHLH